jgi:glyceraldehyde-3-phosphate dehydrogenase (NADP+)
MGNHTNQQLEVKNPYSGEMISRLTYASEQDVTKALKQATHAFEKWRRSPAWERSQLLEQVAIQLESQKTEFANLICQEAGKPIGFARIEVNRAIGVLKWAAAEAPRFSGELLRLDASTSGRAGFGIHTRFPRGPVLGITPFNFPLNLAIHKIAPAIACGCPILIKPSPYTPLTALKLKELFDQVKPGSHLVQVVLADQNATIRLTQAKEVSTLSFTGSSAVGWKIRQQAPEKPTTLELGGNGWIIVDEDTPPALFPAISKRIASAGFGYAGQSCISVQNIAVQSSIWNEFEKFLTQATQETPYGDPTLDTVVSGPVIHSGAQTRILNELKQLPKNLTLVHSNASRNHTSESQNVISPTLVLYSDEPERLAEPLPDIVRNEIFAPVITARKFNELPNLVQKINSSPYGLQSGIFTQNLKTIEYLYQELQVGGLVVNDVPTTRYDHQPYGGVKDSGIGREGIRYAMEEMTESKFLGLSSIIPGIS